MRLIIAFLFLTVSNLTISQNLNCWQHSDNTFTGVCKEYYESGKVRSSLHLELGEPNGHFTMFYENGDTLAKAFINQGKINDIAKLFNEKGELVLKIDLYDNRSGELERYSEGEVVAGGSFIFGMKYGEWFSLDENGEVIKKNYDDRDVNTTNLADASSFKLGSVEQVFFSEIEEETSNVSKDVQLISDVTASFPGGQEALAHYIMNNVVYPTESIDMDEQGKVYMTFIVRLDGGIGEVEVVRGVSESLDNEAIRVVSKMPNWNPALIDNEPVPSLCRLPIVFTLTNGKDARRQRRIERKIRKARK